MTGFGSHGGQDHYVVTNDKEVEFLLERDVAEKDQSAFWVELAAAAPYEKKPAIRARIAVALLYLADGDLDTLRHYRELADRDWRDLFMAAEYPSTPPYGTKESAEEKRARQAEDVRTMATWRNREGPPPGA